ncbi:MAG: sulfotransferase family 2 domain-containing protein [Proteobacteria bacterium]|nr:sulfotransferase family 2 domain-containing protein [Pseudomonadota bacterium]
MSDFLCVSIRIPKSGSSSLARVLEQAFADRRIFFLPHTLDRDGELSALQRARFLRSRVQNLFRHYRAITIATAFDRIEKEARGGDLISGGHVDFLTLRANIARPLKIITLFREPVARALSEYNYSRESYQKKHFLGRIDAAILPKAAGRYSFEGYLDYLLEHRHIYGDVASRYVGWNGTEPIGDFFANHVFHAGILEDANSFVHGLSEKMGRAVSFPHENRTEQVSAESVSRAERSRIEKLFARDFEIYAWQKARV